MDNKYAVLLVRVSTDAQDYKSQKKDLKAFAKDRGYNKYKIIDTTETGFSDIQHKQGVNDMKSFVESNPEYSTVIITELSRYGRRESILHQIRDWHEKNNVQLIIKDDNWQLFNSDGKLNDTLIFSLYANFSAREMKTKMERFARRKRELMALGYSFGGKILFGYKLEKMTNKKNNIVEDTNTSIVVVNIFNWYLNGLGTDLNPSIRIISLHCIKLGYPKYTHSKRNVNKLLKEEAYTGSKVTNNKRKNKMFGLLAGEPEYITTSNELIYDKIISKQLYNDVQAKLSNSRVVTTRTSTRVILLSKIIKCPACNRTLGGNNRSKNGYDKSSYRCTSRADTVRCSLYSKSYPMTLIDSALWSYLKNNDIVLGKSIQGDTPSLELIELEFQRTNLMKRNLLLEAELNISTQILSKLNGGNSAISSLIDIHTKKVNRLSTEIDSLNNEIVTINNSISAINVKSNDIDSIWSGIVTAGRDRKTIKKYLAIFISKIEILHHSVRYTCLKVFNIDGINRYLLIDKRVTRNPKMFGLNTLPDNYDFTSIDLDDWGIENFKKLKESALVD